MHSAARMKRMAEQRRAANPYQRPVRSREISEAALIEREITLRLAPQSLTARIMGDPLPGRSALDKKLLAGAR